MFIQKYVYRTNNGEVGKEYRIGEFPVYLKERGVTQILPGIGKTTRHSEIAAYLKINRKDQYSIFCLQEWIETFHRLNYDCFIVCDNPALYKILEKIVVFPSRRFQIIKSQTRVFNSLLRKMISKCWLKAGIAHFTTFSHAEKKVMRFFGMLMRTIQRSAVMLKRDVSCYGWLRNMRVVTIWMHSPMICGGLVV